MISMIQPLPVGNALRVYLLPPAGALANIVLRNTTGTFAGYNDPTATQVYQGTQNSVLDYQGLDNGTTYYYADFYLVGGSWVAGNVVSAVPASTYVDASTDALTLVRDRISAGMQAEVAAGSLVPKSGLIRVLTAPPVFDDTLWPVVVVHVESDGSDQRAIGEEIGASMPDPVTGTWADSEGWQARVQLSVTGYSLNPDERISLRQAIRRVILANLPVFNSAGMTEVSFSQQDVEDFTSYGAPVYFTTGTFSCLSPAAVSDAVPAVTDVTVTSSVPEPIAGLTATAIF